MQNTHTLSLSLSLTHTHAHTSGLTRWKQTIFSKSWLEKPNSKWKFTAWEILFAFKWVYLFLTTDPRVPPLACLSACMSVSPFKDISRGVSDSNHWLLLSLCCCHYNKSIFMSHSITVSLNFSGCLCLSERERKRNDRGEEKEGVTGVFMHLVWSSIDNILQLNSLWIEFCI